MKVDFFCVCDGGGNKRVCHFFASVNIYIILWDVKALFFCEKYLYENN